MGNCLSDRVPISRSPYKVKSRVRRKKALKKSDQLTKSGSTLEKKNEEANQQTDWLNPENTCSIIITSPKNSKKRMKKKKSSKVLKKSSPVKSQNQKQSTEFDERIEKKRASILNAFKPPGDIIEEQSYHSEVKKYNSRVQMDFRINRKKAGPISVPFVLFEEVVGGL